MTDNINDRQKDADKVNRTLLRLKHTLAYDREKREMDRQSAELLVKGILPKLQVDLNDLLDQ